MSDSRTLADRVRAAEPRALARAISMVEDESREGEALIAALFTATGRARIVGITGPPGAGKSTLVDRLAAAARGEGHTVGILAVDPTSPFTGGAILGDRIRMGAHAADAGVFVRSMATRGHLGGLARATSDAALVLDAAGFDVILIETVGVGQDEIDIVRTADVSVVTLVPGTGDDVQALKAGIMEIADVFVVNKADRDGADRLAHSVEAMLALRDWPAGQWRPPILKTVATDGTGVADVWNAIQRFREGAPDRASARERLRADHRLRDVLVRRFVHYVSQRVPRPEWDHLLDEIAGRRLDPYHAAAGVMKTLLGDTVEKP